MRLKAIASPPRNAQELAVALSQGHGKTAQTTPSAQRFRPRRG